MKIQNGYFYPFINANHLEQIQINLIKKFRKKLKNVDFGSKSDTFAPFWAQ